MDSIYPSQSKIYQPTQLPSIQRGLTLIRRADACDILEPDFFQMSPGSRLTRLSSWRGPVLFIAMFGPVKGCNNSQRGASDGIITRGEQGNNIPSQYVCNIVTHASPTESSLTFACFLIIWLTQLLLNHNKMII